MISVLKAVGGVVAGLFGLLSVALLVMNWVLFAKNILSHKRGHSLVPFVVPICAWVAMVAARQLVDWLPTPRALLIVAAAIVLDPGTFEILIALITGRLKRGSPNDAA